MSNKHEKGRFRRCVLQVVGVATALSIVAACGGSSSDSAAESSDRIIVGTTAVTESITPLEQGGATYQFAMFDALVKVTPGQDPEPALALSWEPTSPTTWRFTLRDGVKFHDGSVMTAKDVAFTVNEIIEKQYAAATLIPAVTGATVIDDSTVEINTNEPDPVLLDRLALIFVVPEATFSELGPDGFAQNPIGTGAYRFASFTPSQSLELVANEDYWGEQPTTPNVTLNYYEDSQALESALIGGQLDVAHMLPATAADSVTGDGFELWNGDGGGTGFLQMNTLVKPFDDVRVRQAVNLAIDAEALNGAVENGLAVLEPGQLPTDKVFGWDEAISRPAPDLDRARQLLAEAGYPDGFSTSITGMGLSSGLMTAISGQLRNIGIEMNVVELSIPDWLELFRNGTDAPVFLRNPSWAGIYDAERMYQYIDLEKGVSMVDDPTWSQIYGAQAVELDPNKRLELLQEAADYVNEQQYVIWTYRDVGVAANKKGHHRSCLRPCADPGPDHDRLAAMRAAVKAAGPLAVSVEEQATGVSVRNLRVTLTTPDGPREVLHGVDLDVGPGEIVGVVGESGSGKSMTMHAITRLLPAGSSTGGEVVVAGQDVLELPQRQMWEVRRRLIRMIFQDPLGSFDPLKRLGTQLVACGMPGESARATGRRAEDLLAEMGIPDVSRAMRARPNELSGGQLQRVALASAMLGRAPVLLCDEPTTALDPTTQLQIIELIKQMRDMHGTSILISSHDMGVISALASRIVVMYAGRVVESGRTQEVLTSPKHPYTESLIASLPSMRAYRGQRLPTVAGRAPGAGRLPAGCAFHPRCSRAEVVCSTTDPATTHLTTGQNFACHVAAKQVSSKEVVL
jgi:oligopeptide/dipeptide ABC transporter ATP-binding protein